MTAFRTTLLAAASALAILAGEVAQAQAQVVPQGGALAAGISANQPFLVPVQHDSSRREYVMAVQELLQSLGLYGGPIDGIDGDGTWQAIRTFQSLAGIISEGFPSEHFELLSRSAEILLVNEVTVSEAIYLASRSFESCSLEVLEIGITSLRRGAFTEAERQLREALDCSEAILGPENLQTLDARYNLALTLGYQGRWQEAESEYRQLLVYEDRVFGPQHPDTLRVRINLAEAIAHQGRFLEAENLYRQIGEAQADIFPPNHPDYLTTLNNLSNILKESLKNLPALA